MFICFGEDLTPIRYIYTPIGYIVFTVRKGAIISNSGKQNYIADSTIEAEYVVTCETTNEVV